MNFCPLIVITGGPGGGKTTLINELSRELGLDRAVFLFAQGHLAHG